MHFFSLLPMESFPRFEVSFLSAKWLTFLEKKIPPGYAKSPLVNILAFPEPTKA